MGSLILSIYFISLINKSNDDGKLYGRGSRALPVETHDHPQTANSSFHVQSERKLPCFELELINKHNQCMFIICL